MSNLPALEESTQQQVSIRQQVFSLLSPKVQTAILNIPDELLMMNEEELEHKFKPSNLDFMIRRRLWEKFREAGALGLSNIPNIEIYRGICTDQNFYDRVLKNPEKLAWLIHPVQDPDEMLKEAYEFSLKKVREILRMPVDAKSAPAILKAAEFLTNRVKGPVVQRLETRNLNVSVDSEKPMTNDEISEKLLELQEKIKDTKNPKKMTDVEAE